MKAMTNWREKIPKSCSRRQKFFLLSLVPMYFMTAGFFLQPSGQLFMGLLKILREPDFLITDYFLLGGPGAALVNGGLLCLVSIWMIYFLGRDMEGHTVTSTMLMLGFALFGKNLINIWTILLGVYVYAGYHKVPFSKYIYVALYGTSLSPIVTQMMYVEGLPAEVQLALTVLAGLSIGFVLPPLSTWAHFAHKGYSLYNVGFSAGIIATVFVSLMKSFGIETQSRLLWYSEDKSIFALLLILLCVIFIIGGSLFGGKAAWRRYIRILKSTGIAGTDYLVEYGGCSCLINMGINGIFAAVFVLAVGGDLNGPTIGGIMTIIGFSTTGKHLRNISSIMVGVWLASLTKKWNISDPGPMLALLFSTNLAPIAGQYGVLAGLLTGVLHSSVALNVGIVYGGMNLYNNGFAGGLVAIFMVPLLQSLVDRRSKAKGSL